MIISNVEITRNKHQIVPKICEFSVIFSDLWHDGEVVMREKPHSSVSLGSLPLQELSQQPLHLPVSGVCTLHRLLCVETIKRTQRMLRNAGWQWIVRGRGNPEFQYEGSKNIGASSGSGVTWRTANHVCQTWGQRCQTVIKSNSPSQWQSGSKATVCLLQ